MPITPLDIQTSITGSQSVSEARGKEQATENIRQQNPHGEIKDMEKKAIEEVNKYDPDQAINPDEEKEKEEQEKKKRAQEEEEEMKKKKESKPVSDGVRGLKLDFKA